MTGQTNSFNKRLAFTLAEVLLTLTIIGIIASYTIPDLIQNIQNQQLKIAWKKKYSEISQATNQIIEDRGSMIGIDTTTTDAQALRNLYKGKINTLRDCVFADQRGLCWHNNGYWYDYDGVTPLTTGAISIGQSSVLPDGSFLAFHLVSDTCTYSLGGTGFTDMCGWLYIDTNGFKGPNTRGKDIMEIYIFKDRIKPQGVYGNSSTINKEAALLLQ